MKTFYEIPTQVKFKEETEADWSGGIAFEDKVICMCCGGIELIEDIIELGGDIVEFDWLDLSKEIMGCEY